MTIAFDLLPLVQVRAINTTTHREEGVLAIVIDNVTFSADGREVCARLGLG